MKSKEWRVERDPVRRLLANAIGPLITFVLLSTLYSLLSTPVSAQDDPDLAPPPLRTVTKNELSKLGSTDDIKARTKLALDMMTAHILAAEQLNGNADFDGMFRELGGFQGLLDNSLDYLKIHDNNSNKILDNFKRLEIGIRAFSPRLEAIRRDLPTRYEDYVRTLLIYVRDARSRAMEPMFSDTVVPNKKNP